MPMLDVFRSDAFSTVSLTAAINKLPYVPSRLGEMGLFVKKGIANTTAVVDEQLGRLMLVQTASRGTMPNAYGGKRRQAKAFLVPHLPLNSAVMAEDVQNIRAFGSEAELETVVNKVNDKLAEMKQNLETTKEWHRIGAIQGIILDADGTTVIYNLFTEFSLTQKNYTIDFSYGTSGSTDVVSSNTSVKQVAAQVKRYMQDKLGATPFQEIHALVGSQAYDGLITCHEVQSAYNRYMEGQFLRDQQARTVGGFPYAGVVFEEYRGWLGSTPFLPVGQFNFFPVGVPDLFQEIMAPADFIEAVNTVGQEYYAKQEIMKFDVGVELHTQTNPLMICNRPQVLVSAGMIGYAGS